MMPADSGVVDAGLRATGLVAEIAPAVATPAGLGAARAHFLARSLGPVGWTGIAALLLAAVGAGIVRPALERSNDAQAQQIAALQQQWMRLRDPKAAQAQRDPVGTLVASLPPVSSVPDFVAAIQRRADQDAVQIDRTEYRVQVVLGRSAQRYRLSFPAHVDYPHLRTWLEALLHDYPSLTLDEISLRREVDGGEELEAHVGLSFLARDKP
jgi:hypothetical protein